MSQRSQRGDRSDGQDRVEDPGVQADLATAREVAEHAAYFSPCCARYVGPDDGLRGQSALLLLRDASATAASRGRVLAQFDQIGIRDEHGIIVSHGWREFSGRCFRVTSRPVADRPDPSSPSPGSSVPIVEVPETTR